MTFSDDTISEDLHDLYENAPVGYLSLGADGKIVKLNTTFATWLGRDANALIGKRFRDLLNVAGSVFYETHFAPLLRMQGHFEEVALVLVTASGVPLPVLVNAVERRDDHGAVLFTRIAIFPARQRRKFERELVDAQAGEREARRMLVELNSDLEKRIRIEEEVASFREQFIAVLGHDMRNPVAAVEAGTNMLLAKGWTDRSETILRLMLNSTARMYGLIDNVLDLARARLGDGIPLQIEVDRRLQPTLEQVVNEIRAANPERVVEASYRLDDSVPVDHLRLAQMLSNLLGNAMTHGAADHPVTVTCLMGDGRLEIAVTNAGAPISDEIVEHLFKPFRRGDVRSNAEGLGLGLYIASQIAEAHGGRIAVVSDEIQTRFTFAMPAQ
nr:PAS domain-containing sensor histidine kinase [uncultured Devosia sp.]